MKDLTEGNTSCTMPNRPPGRTAAIRNRRGLVSLTDGTAHKVKPPTGGCQTLRWNDGRWWWSVTVRSSLIWTCSDEQASESWSARQLKRRASSTKDQAPTQSRTGDGDARNLQLY